MTELAFKPPAGLVNDGTPYSARGAWFVGDRIRFKEGLPQKLGGWLKQDITYEGVCRNLHSWRDLLSRIMLGIGTNSHYYVSINGALTDITPYGSGPTAIGNNGITAIGGGSSQIVVTTTVWTSFVSGSMVTIDGVVGTVGDYSADDLNGNFVAYRNGTDTGSLIVDVVTTSINPGSGGGASMEISYYLPTGGVDAYTGNGWGGGGWGEGPWGGGSNYFVAGQGLRLWSSDNFGEDLIINPRGFGIYYWDASAGGRAEDISTLDGADETPVICNYTLVSSADRRVFAFGTNNIGEDALDPVLIRWSDSESAADWNPSVTNTAGDLRLSLGSEIYCAAVAKGQILVWTESSLHTLQFIGGDLTYGTQLLSPTIDILGPNAAIAVGDFAMWMGRENFYIYDGSVKIVPCAVREYVFSSINLNQAWKVAAASNGLHREIWFFYPSSSSTENDRYVVFNYTDNAWYFGNMDRTAWVDRGVQNYPIAASPNSDMFFQEYGFDDGSTDPATPLNSYITSGPIEIDSPDLGDGDRFSFVRRIIPDITFINSTNETPSVDYVLTASNYPGGPTYAPGGGTVVQTISTPVAQYTPRIDTRIRGRQFTITITDDQLGVNWRLGIQRFDIQPDGRR